jgi:hypothetical protein
MSSVIYFVVDSIPEPLRTLLARNQPLPSADRLKPDLKTIRDIHWFWLVQTFLTMKKAGLNVDLVEQPVKNAICIVHFDMTKNKVWAPDSFVVGIRADRSPLRMCEIEIVQSPANLNSGNVFLMQYWPQSGLIPRDTRRGNRIERMSYFGGEGGLSPQFREPAFIRALADLGVELKLNYNPALWNDYRHTDLVLAVRNNLHPLLLETKPASKLVNTWQAQCVALLGNEPAFRMAGRPGKDYFEVNQPQDVLDRVAILKKNPDLYQRVRQAGIDRYPQFSFEAVQAQWIDLLTGPITDAFIQWQKDLGHRKVDRHIRRSVQSVHQWIDHKIFYACVRSKQWLERQPLYSTLNPALKPSPPHLERSPS